MDALANAQGSFTLFYQSLSSLGRDKVLSSVASVIKSHFQILYPEKPFKKPVGRPKKLPVLPIPSLDLPVDVDRFFNFSGMGKFRSEFGAELILRNLYSHLDSSSGTMVIDEFHHVSRAGSVLDTLLREFRVSGQLVGISQSLSDVSPSMISNFGYIFIGRSIHPNDLSFLEILDPKLPRLVAGLPPFTFLSLHEYLSGHVALYRWFDD
jgi:hypothetical protein